MSARADLHRTCVVKCVAAGELDALRQSFATESVDLDTQSDAADARARQYWRELEHAVAGHLRTRFPCTADLLGRPCFGALVRRLIVDRPGLDSLRQAEQVFSGGWLGGQHELKMLPWLGELLRLEAALAAMADARALRRSALPGLLYFRSGQDVIRLYDWWRKGMQGRAPSLRARCAALLVLRSTRMHLLELPCARPANVRAGGAGLETVLPGT